MHSKLELLVQEHATRHGDDQRHERWPPSLPHEKQYQHKHNNPYRSARTELSQRVQHARECRSKPVMKPSGDSLISALKRIR